MTDILLMASLPDTMRGDLIRSATFGSKMVCPKCDGGRTRERSLDVRGIGIHGIGVTSLKCFRASCGWRALVASSPDEITLHTKKLAVAKPYSESTYPLNFDQRKLLTANYSCDSGLAIDHGWRSNKSGDTLILPIVGPCREQRGHITRTITKPKRVYTFKTSAQPFLDWWRDDLFAGVVIVEDCISALRLYSIGISAVAILGTNISTEQAKEIAKYADGRVYLALDNDAFGKAIKLSVKHSHIVKMIPVLLSEDIKDMKDDEEVRSLFS